LLIDKGADRQAANKRAQTPLLLGLDGALAAMNQEEERRKEQVEQLARARQLKAEQLQQERECEADRLEKERLWREKLQDEHSFEHMDGWGAGVCVCVCVCVRVRDSESE